MAIKRAGGLPLLARLVKMRQASILVPVIGTLQVNGIKRVVLMSVYHIFGTDIRNIIVESFISSTFLTFIY